MIAAWRERRLLVQRERLIAQVAALGQLVRAGQAYGALWVAARADLAGVEEKLRQLSRARR